MPGRQQYSRFQLQRRNEQARARYTRRRYSIENRRSRGSRASINISRLCNLPSIPSHVTDDDLTSFMHTRMEIINAARDAANVIVKPTTSCKHCGSSLYQGGMKICTRSIYLEYVQRGTWGWVHAIYSCCSNIHSLQRLHTDIMVFLPFSQFLHNCYHPIHTTRFQIPPCYLVRSLCCALRGVNWNMLHRREIRLAFLATSSCRIEKAV